MSFPPPLCRPRPWLAAWVALCIALWAWPLAAATQAAQSAPLGRILEQTLVNDPSGQSTLAQVRQQTAQHFHGALVRMQASAAVWIRLRIAPSSPAQAAAPQHLRVVPMWNRSLRLYDPLRTDASGQMAPLDAGKASTLFDVQTLPLAHGPEPRDVWLRLETSVPLYLKVTLLSATELAEQQATDHLVLGMVIGLHSMLILVGLIVWMSDRRGIGPSMFAKQVLNLTIVLLNSPLWDLSSGFAGTAGEAAVEGLRLLNMAVSLWFFTRVLTLLDAPKRMLRVQHLSLGVIALGALPVLAGQLALARGFVFLLYAAVPVGLVASGAFCLRGLEAPDTRWGRFRRMAERWLLGFALWTAWMASFSVGMHRAQDLSFIVVMMTLFTLCAVGVLLVAVWRRVDAHRQQQAADRHRAELGALALEFERGERKRQQEFMAMLTHELKAPLSTLAMVIGSPSASASMLRHAQQALASMRQVIDHCAQSAEIEDGAPPARQAGVLAVELGLRLDAQADAGRFQLNAPAPLPPVLADKRMLAVIFNNLLDNALKYSPQGSVIQVSVVREPHPQGAVQRVSVRNAALPGPLPDANRVFQKYYRGDAVQRLSGSGLGLHLSRQLARRMGGDLLYQASGREVCFTLLLPEPEPEPDPVPKATDPA